MDRVLLISLLRAAEQRLANAEQQIATQRDLISSLERAGRDTSSAHALLRQIEQTQLQDIGDREWLRSKLQELNAIEDSKADPPASD